MPTRFYSLRTACRSWLLALGFALLALVPAVSFAQSACTAMWGIVTTGGAAPSRLGFFNNSAGTAAKFTTLSFTLAGEPMPMRWQATLALAFSTISIERD